MANKQIKYMRNDLLYSNDETKKRSSENTDISQQTKSKEIQKEGATNKKKAINWEEEEDIIK